MTTNKNKHIDEAYQILISLGLPRAQHNERSALCLLALLNHTPLASQVAYASRTIFKVFRVNQAQKGTQSAPGVALAVQEHG